MNNNNLDHLTRRREIIRCLWLAKPLLCLSRHQTFACWRYARGLAEGTTLAGIMIKRWINAVNLPSVAAKEMQTTSSRRRNACKVAFEAALKVWVLESFHVFLLFLNTVGVHTEHHKLRPRLLECAFNGLMYGLALKNEFTNWLSF